MRACDTNIQHHMLGTQARTCTFVSLLKFSFLHYSGRLLQRNQVNEDAAHISLAIMVSDF